MTIRRDMLFRQVKAGKMEARSLFHYTDGEPYSEASATWKPARISEGHGDFRDGYFNLHEYDFRTKSGMAYVSDPRDGVVTLRVHSNCIHELRERRSE